MLVSHLLKFRNSFWIWDWTLKPSTFTIGNHHDWQSALLERLREQLENNSLRTAAHWTGRQKENGQDVKLHTGIDELHTLCKCPARWGEGQLGVRGRGRWGWAGGSQGTAQYLPPSLPSFPYPTGMNEPLFTRRGLAGGLESIRAGLEPSAVHDTRLVQLCRCRPFKKDVFLISVVHDEDSKLICD